LHSLALFQHSVFSPPESRPKTTEFAKEHETGTPTEKQPKHTKPDNARRKAQS